MRTGPALVMVMAAAILANAGVAQADALDSLAQAAALGQAGDHADAITLYERAYAETGDHDVLVLLGGEQHAAGQIDAALANLCSYLESDPDGILADGARSQIVAMQAQRGVQVDATSLCTPTSGSARPAMPGLTPPAERMLPPIGPAAGLSTRQLTGLSLAGAGVASAALGVYFGFQARAISDDIAGHATGQPWPDDIRDQEQRGQRAEGLQSAFLLGGAVAIGVGTYLYVTGRSERLVIAPSASATAGGVSISGGF